MMNKPSWSSLFRDPKYPSTLAGGFMADLTCMEANEWDAFLRDDHDRNAMLIAYHGAKTELDRYSSGAGEDGLGDAFVAQAMGKATPLLALARDWFAGLQQRRAEREAAEEKRMDEEYKARQAEKKP